MKPIWLLAIVAWHLLARGAGAIDMTVKNGRQLAKAFADPTVDTATLFTSIQLHDTDFPSAILNMSRNFTVQSTTATPLTLDFNLVKGKVRMLNNVRLTVKGLILVSWRSGSANQAPGIDLLLPVTPSSSGPPVLVILNSFLYYRNCFPVSIALQSFRLATRPPEIPGNNTFDFPIYPPAEHVAHCVNDSSAPYMDQCYVYRAGYIDMAVHGLDVSATGTPSPNGYLVHSLNSYAICAASYPMDCIVRLGPIGCVLFTLSQQSPPPPPASLPPGSGSSTSPATAAIVGGVVGGVVGAALLVAAALLLLPRWSRWRKRQQQQQVPDETAKPQQEDTEALAGADGDVGGPSPRATEGGTGNQVDHGVSYAEQDTNWSTNQGDRPFCDAPAAVAAAALLPSVTVVTAMTPPRADLCLDARISVIKPQHSQVGSAPHNFADTAAGAPALGAGAVTGAGLDCTGRPTSGAAPTSTTTGAMARTITNGGVTDTGDAIPSPSRAAPAHQGSPLHGAAAPHASPDAAGGGAGGLGSPMPGGGGGRRSGDGDCVLAATVTDGNISASNEVRLLPRVLGKGAFGRVHEGEYRGQRVAVKVLLDSAFGDLVGAPHPHPPVHPSPVAAAHSPFQRATSGPAGGSGDAGAAAPGTAVYEDLLTGAGGDGDFLPPLPTMARLTGSESGAALGTGSARLAEKGAWLGMGAAGHDQHERNHEQQRPEQQRSEHQHHQQEHAAGAAGVVEAGAAAEGEDDDGQDREHVWHDHRARRLLRQFEQEVEVLGRCDHPAVVKLLAACLTPPRLCLVMELCETSLEALIYGRPGQLLELPTILHIAVQVAEGLSYLHPTIIHRDLKPANVLIQGADSPRPVAKLTDFGLSRLRMATVATMHPDAGTPAYLAPECFSTDTNVVTHHMDMYALGILLWSMLTGLRPWRAQCQSVVIIAYRVTMLGERPPLDQLSERRCPAKLKRLIKQCWEHDPRKRPAAAQMVKELSELLRQCDDANGVSTESALLDTDTGNMLGPATGAAPHLTPTAAASLLALRAFSTKSKTARSPQRALVAAAAMAGDVRSEGGAPSAAPPVADTGVVFGRGSSKHPWAEAAAAQGPESAAASDLHRVHSMPQQQASQQQQQQGSLSFLKAEQLNGSSSQTAKGITPGEGAAGTLVSGTGTGSGSRSEGRAQPQQTSGSAMAASSSSSISEPHVHFMNMPAGLAQQLMQGHAAAAAAAAAGHGSGGAGGVPLLPLPYAHQYQHQQLTAAGQIDSSHMFSSLIPHQHNQRPPAQRSSTGEQQFMSSEAISNTALLKQLAGIELDMDLVAASGGGSSSASSTQCKDPAALARAAAAAARALRAGLGTPVTTASAAPSGEDGGSSRSAAGVSGEGGDARGGCVAAAGKRLSATPTVAVAIDAE